MFNLLSVERILLEEKKCEERAVTSRFLSNKGATSSHLTLIEIMLKYRHIAIKIVLLKYLSERYLFLVKYVTIFYTLHKFQTGFAGNITNK